MRTLHEVSAKSFSEGDLTTRSKMKILFVAMSESIHVTKWLSLCSNPRDKLFLYPSNTTVVHTGIDRNRTVFIDSDPLLLRLCKPFGRKVYQKIKSILHLLHKIFGSPDRTASLSRVIKRISPDLIHSMETQHSGYLVLECKERFFSREPFPLWLHTNWGSDIYLFGRLDGHREKVNKIMRQCDFYSCESRRDIELGHSFGYRGQHFDPFPNACGFNLKSAEALRNQMLTSSRKIIMVKGYQGWSGRALFSLSALAMVADKLNGYEVLVFSAAHNEEVKIAAQLLHLDHGVEIRILGDGISHQCMLEQFASARVYLGLNISDGISTSLLEAMAMGAFPIQSSTSTAAEWIVDGVSGFVVPPEDPGVVAQRLAEALDNDKLVDSAANLNWKTISERADSNKIKLQIDAIYKTISDSVKLTERNR